MQEIKKMKIGLIVPANLKYSPYVKYYIDILRAVNADFRIMSWDKTGIDEKADMRMAFPASDFDRKKILRGHWLFARKCKRYILQEQINSLIIFTIAPLFFLGQRFLKRFSNHIVVDVRDDSPFRRLFPKHLDRMARLANLIVVSSPFYAEWFGRESLLCHNADLDLIYRYSDCYVKKLSIMPANIAYAGMMIEEQVNIRAIDELANNGNYRMVFIGRENERKAEIERHVAERHIQNVSFIGEYKKEDIVDLYRSEADFVNILRENTLINRNALPNKLYEAVVSGIPVVVYEHNAAIAYYVKKYGLGILLNEEENLEKQLTDRIKVFNYDRYVSGRSAFLDLVTEDYKHFRDRLIHFCLQ